MNMSLSLAPIILLAILSATPLMSSAGALFAGIVLSLVFQAKLPTKLKSSSRISMQVAIVLLGFSMSPSQMLQSGRQGLIVTLVSLLLTLGVGYLLGRWLKLDQKLGYLISCGSGICGGTAINSIAPVIRASDSEVAVSLACVFILNAIALITFPAIGNYLGLSTDQFGWLAAIAIHDTSSVVGAATHFSPESVNLAITAKLTRALWIIPLMMVTAWILHWRSMRREATGEGAVKPKWPLFIFVFVGAVLLHGILPDMPEVYLWTDKIGKSLLKVAIFLLGLQLTRKMVLDVGLWSMLHATLVWFFVTTGSLLWIMNFVK